MATKYSYNAQLATLRAAQVHFHEALREMEKALDYEVKMSEADSTEYEEMKAQMEGTWQSLDAMIAGVHELALMQKGEG